MVTDPEDLQRRLRALFLEELEEGIRGLTEGLLQLEQDHSGDEQRTDVRELFRYAHGLKGAAHAAGVDEAVTICDRMESTFAAIRHGDLAPDATVVASLLGDVDALQDVAASLGGHPASRGDDRRAHHPQSADPPSSVGTSPKPGPVSAQQPASQARAGDAAPVSRSPTPSSVRIAVDKLDALLATAGEALAASQRLAALSGGVAGTATAVEASRQHWRTLDRASAMSEGNGLGPLLDEASSRVAALEQSVDTLRRDLGHATAAVADAAQGLRLQAVGDACDGLERVVRDVAAGSGKQARLLVRGGGVEVDRAVVAALRDPLLHLVRNAVDHGIETPADRVTAGKPAIGTVTVSAEMRQSMLAVVVSDDGAGVDLTALQGAAEQRGVTVPSTPLELAFLPGLTTRTDVTAVSGRGVGLDAVRVRIEQIGGSVDAASEAGDGTTFTIMAPTTLATMRVLVAEAAGEVVCLPIAALERVTTVATADVREVEGQTVVNIDGTTRRLLSLAGALGFAGGELEAARLQVVLTRGGGAGFIADRFLEDRDVVVKPAPPRLAGTVATLGVAVLSGGNPALVVSPPALLRGRRGGSVVVRQAADRPRRPRILLAEDTVTTRALERSILESAGYEVVAAVDGAHAWQLLAAEEVDLVVSDVQMPGMDGFALCEAIRAAPSLQELPVVLVTSLASDDDRGRGMQVGADAYFVKSDFRQGNLLETIQRLL